MAYRYRLLLTVIFVLVLGVWASWYYYLRYLDRSTGNIPEGILELAEYNYGDEVREVAQELELPYNYLMALIVLESSGRKPAGKRFEKHVYRRLTALRDGRRNKFEDIKQEDIHDATDEALKNLATSWGPFQLMGYKCLGLGVEVKDIRDKNSLLLGGKWIKKEYGHLLQAKRFKDAFHYHNTGRTIPLTGVPRTHDPQYIYKGEKYMKFFGAKAD